MRQPNENVMVESGPSYLQCTHHWVIETPSGPASLGYCKVCGIEKEFQNFIENNPYWEEDTESGQAQSNQVLRSVVALPRKTDEFE